MVVGIGIDMVEIKRIKRVVDKHREAFIKRIYTDTEQARIDEFWERGAMSRVYEFMAGRFAVKEAVAKTLGCGIGQVGWRDIEIRYTDLGAPKIVLTGYALKLAHEKKIEHWHVSISHTSDMAIAYVLAEG